MGPPTATYVKETPLNIVVPAPSTPVTAIDVAPGATAQKKDSVELLLEGMAGPRPVRVRTTPQTGGESSASYHAEHGVHRGQAPLEAEPKVLVERPAVESTEPSPAISIDPNARPTSPPSGLRAGDLTVVTRDDLPSRLVVAFVAGLLVVVALFLVLRVMSSRAPDDVVAGPAPPRLTVPAGPPPEVQVLAPVPPAREAPLASALPLEPAAGVPANEEAAPPASEHAAPGGQRRRPAARGSVPSSSNANLGEFKTKF